jgi:hypothetical protein
MLISKPILDGLKAAGFFNPSPIQLKACPLGKLGLGMQTSLFKQINSFENQKFVIIECIIDPNF